MFFKTYFWSQLRHMYGMRSTHCVRKYVIITFCLRFMTKVHFWIVHNMYGLQLWVFPSSFTIEKAVCMSNIDKNIVTSKTYWMWMIWEWVGRYKKKVVLSSFVQVHIYLYFVVLLWLTENTEKNSLRQKLTTIKMLPSK